MDDVVFLPLHHLAIQHFQENLHNMNRVNSTIFYSLNMVPILQQGEPYEGVYYRFFPTPKEVFNVDKWKVMIGLTYTTK